MSLQEFFLQRALQEHQNELNKDNFAPVIMGLAQGVMQGIQQQQAAMQERRKAELKDERDIENFTKKQEILHGKRIETDLQKEARIAGIDYQNKNRMELEQELTDIYRQKTERGESLLSEMKEGVDEGKIDRVVTRDKDGNVSVRYQSKERGGGLFGSTVNEEEVEQITEGIKGGRLSPRIRDYGLRASARIAASAERKGMNLTTMESELNAVQRWISSTNSVGQVRFRQVIDSLLGSLENLEKINEEFSRTGWTPANAAEILAARTGTNPKKRDIASQYLTQIKQIQAELGQVFMGGNSPTDRALKLAESSINENFGYDQMKSVLATIKDNVRFRANAIDNSGPQLFGGESITSPYLVGRRGAFFEEESENFYKKMELFNRMVSEGADPNFAIRKSGITEEEIEKYRRGDYQ